ncbi:MAG: hypothetical protein Tsb009_29540 [Planctomycetaceae bacterium]
MTHSSRLRSMFMVPVHLAGRVHRDERGTVSILTVFALFMFTILLVKVVNVGRHLDDKLRRQNAADAAAYSGAVVVARSMNTLAFTNHLEAEVFALNAYMQTALMQNEADGSGQVVNSFMPQILAKWAEVGRIFEQHGGSSGYQKFRDLGRAIREKVPLERDVASTFTEMSARHAELTLPVLDYILHAGEGDFGGGLNGGGSFGGAVNVPDGGFIPRFQRAVIRATPLIADIASNELARRHGQPGEKLRGGSRAAMAAHMWRTDVYCLATGDEENPLTRTIPAIDPSPTGTDGPPERSYFLTAVNQRRSLAFHYLELWIKDWQGPYFSWANGGGRGQNRPGRSTAKMSNFINLWRTFARGHLRVLLEVKYPETNLPHVIRNPLPTLSENDSLERDHRFVAVTYWKHVKEMFPGLFKNRLSRDPGYDPQTFAQAAVFIPRNRYLCCPWAWPYWVRIQNPDGTYSWQLRWRNNMQGWPQNWDLLNQNWSAKLVPASTRTLGLILEQSPPRAPDFRSPRFNGLQSGDIHAISKH